MRKKKSLGQHFLRSKTALRKIIDAAKLSKGENVLEIGPGEGALTERLLAEGARVVAVETDPRCIEVLKERFASAIAERSLELIEGDVREASLHERLFARNALGNADYKLVANIPYYITGMLLRLFLEHLRQPTSMVLLVQKEVADEIARSEKEGILSLSVKAYGDPRYVAKVDREAFSPPPKVDSAVIAVESVSKERLGGMPDENYFRVIKAGLASRRKMLLPNLAKNLDMKREMLEVIFKELSIDERSRGEDITAEKWLALAKRISKNFQ